MRTISSFPDPFKRRRALGLALALLASSAAAAAACNVGDGTLLGNWEATGQGAAFEQLAFEREGSRHEFSSWRHERPEIAQAEWRLEDCKLTIQESSGTSQTYAVSFRGGRLLLASLNGKAAGAYRRIEEPPAEALELRTPGYAIRITENCRQAEVPCGDVRYEGRNIRTGSSITLRGQAVAGDGYRFRSGDIEYRVTRDGLLRVTQASKVLVEERGQWRTATAPRPAAADPLPSRLGIALPADYASARAQLVRTAWKPDAGWGKSAVSERLAYASYPEILCGQGYEAVCTGRFEKGNEAVLLVLDRKTRSLRVTAIEQD